MTEGKKIYFASDFHLGLDAGTSSRERERKIVRWLQFIKKDASAVYLVGDIFDYWFEYKSSVPKGFIRFQGALAELLDAGIDIYMFTGNHDMWLFSYFEDELGIKILRQPIKVTLGTKSFFIGHGDGLDPKDVGYNVIKAIFANKICQWLFSMLHPTWALSIMRRVSGKERKYPGDHEPYHQPTESMLNYCEQDCIKNDIDYYVFGHRHLPIIHRLNNDKSMYFNLGEWMYSSSYCVFDGTDMELRFFESEYQNIYGNKGNQV